MRSAIVTGGRKGLGRALVDELAVRGWRVFSFSRTLEDDVVENIHWFRGDVTDEASLRRIRAEIAARTASVDLLINNAGSGGTGALLNDVSTESVQAQLEVHCLGAMRCVQAFFDLLMSSPKPLVVNVTSRFGSTSTQASGEIDASGISYGYRISKAAQNMLTQCMAHDPSLRKISFVALNPGRLLTDSGASDAQYTAGQAASAICEILEARDQRSGAFVHAFGESTTW